MDCCSCGASLSESHISEVTVYDCSECRGVWVPYRSMAHLAKMEPFGQDLPELLNMLASKVVSPRQCPSCKSASLVLVFIKGVEVDLCNGCKGVFFDEEEIDSTFPKLSERRGNGEGNGALAVSFLGEILSGVLSLSS